MKIKCSYCNGDGWTEEHASGAYDHDENGECLGSCPVQVECEKCNGTGFIESKFDENGMYR